MFCGFSASSRSPEENGETFPHPDIHNLPSREDKVWGGQEEDQRDKGQQNPFFLHINPTSKTLCKDRPCRDGIYFLNHYFPKQVHVSLPAANRSNRTAVRSTVTMGNTEPMPEA